MYGRVIDDQIEESMIVKHSYVHLSVGLSTDYLYG